MLKDNPRVTSMLTQYRPAFNYELAGKKFVIAMDDGHDVTLNFLDKKTVEWSIDGGTPKAESYECLKGDETTYLVTYAIEGAELRTNHTFVIDLENYLVTRCIGIIGENPKEPLLNNTYFEFGAIYKEDGSLEFRRHSFTSDMVGTVMQWCYGERMTTVHVYYTTKFYRITYPRDRVMTEEQLKRQEQMNAMVKELPSSDEPADYIKIKPNMYFVSITEKNMEKILHGKVGFRSNNLCFLQNYNRLYQVGRAFGTHSEGDKIFPTQMMFGAYGKFTEVEQEFIDAPNPFIT